MTLREQNKGVADQRLAARVSGVLYDQLARPLGAGLYLVATPIGNLADISLRALSHLARADLIAAEDTRHTRVLLSHYGLSCEMLAYHDHNGDEMRPRLAGLIDDGGAVVLVSDAGMPLISDPGFKLARAVRQLGHKVEVIPGPSAVLTGLAHAGLPTDRFLFEGFLPNRQEARQRQLLALSPLKASLVFFETVKRVGPVLEDMKTMLGEREVALCREMTKLHEEVIRGPIDEVIRLIDGRRLKGELVIVVGPPKPKTVTDDDITDALMNARADGLSMKDSIAKVSSEFELSRGRVYDLSRQMDEG